MIYLADLEDVEHYLIKNGTKITNKKLQKLLYYAQAWFIVLLNNKGNINYILFENKIEAWKYGPVIADSYFRYCDFGCYLIKIDHKEHNLSKEVITILDLVLQEYDPYTSEEIAEISHLEKPWQDTYIKNQNKEITPFRMYDFYEKENTILNK
jgi:uncharacterized phage-associated protein